MTIVSDQPTTSSSLIELRELMGKAFTKERLNAYSNGPNRIFRATLIRKVMVVYPEGRRILEGISLDVSRQEGAIRQVLLELTAPPVTRETLMCHILGDH